MLRPVVLLEAEQGLGLDRLSAADDAALMELDQLLNLFQGKGKRSQDQADKVGSGWGLGVVYCPAREW